VFNQRCPISGTATSTSAANSKQAGGYAAANLKEAAGILRKTGAFSGFFGCFLFEKTR